jgi:uncharacterized membrane protein
METMSRFGCLPLFLFLLLLVLLPLFFVEVLTTALLKLRLTPETAFLLLMGIVMGSVVNLPVKRLVRREEVVMHPLAVFGLREMWPRLQRIRHETVIAVNVGGCLIPSGLAAFETIHVVKQGWSPAMALALGVMVNIAVCYKLAKPVKGVGIAMPGLIPPVIAALCAVILAPEERAPVAFVSGVLGPLVGADLFHLRDIPRIATGMASIGGAGTFDGIVLSGIVAAYLA